MTLDRTRNFIPEVAPADVQTWLEEGGVLLVDVRETREYDAEHIAGALLLPLSSLDPEFFPVLPGRRVVLHCAIGKRSLAAAKMLRAAGHGDVMHMAGGLDAWKDAGLETELPVEEPARPRPVVHPGRVLEQEYLGPRAMSLRTLAGQTGLAEAALAELVAGRLSVDSEMSLALAKVFSTEPGFWMLLQVDYDMARAQAALSQSAPVAAVG